MTFKQHRGSPITLALGEPTPHRGSGRAGATFHCVGKPVERPEGTAEVMTLNDLDPPRLKNRQTLVASDAYRQ